MTACFRLACSASSDKLCVHIAHSITFDTYNTFRETLKRNVSHLQVTSTASLVQRLPHASPSPTFMPRCHGARQASCYYVFALRPTYWRGPLRERDFLAYQSGHRISSRRCSYRYRLVFPCVAVIRVTVTVLHVGIRVRVLF